MLWKRLVGSPSIGYTLAVLPLIAVVFAATLHEAERRTCLPMFTVYGGPFIIVAASLGVWASPLDGGRISRICRWSHLVCLGLGSGLVLFATR